MFINLDFCYGNIHFSPGIKMGINFTKIDWKNSGFWSRYRETYPRGWNIGLFGETRFSERISVMNEFYFIRNIASHTQLGTTENMFKNKQFMNSIKISGLFQWRPQLKHFPYYLLCGPEVGLLLKAESQGQDLNTNERWDHDTTDFFPVLETFLNLGFGQRFRISGYHFLAEVKGLMSLNEYENGFRRYYALQFILGIYLNSNESSSQK
jgi:hypothetical protein